MRPITSLLSRGGNTGNSDDQKFRSQTYLNYLISICMAFLGLGFWSGMGISHLLPISFKNLYFVKVKQTRNLTIVPLYRMFCESIGQGDAGRGGAVKFL